MATQQSRKQRRRVRRTRRRQRGGANVATIVNLQGWLRGVHEAAEKLKGSTTLMDMPFENFRIASLQLPPLKEKTGQDEPTSVAEPEFQLEAEGKERIFEDSDIRQIGNALRSNPQSRASQIAPGHTVSDFKKFRPVDADESDDKLLVTVEQALRYADVPALGKNPIPVSDETNYPLYLFYLVMNLPENMNPDNAIPLVLRTTP